MAPSQHITVTGTSVVANRAPFDGASDYEYEDREATEEAQHTGRVRLGNYVLKLSSKSLQALIRRVFCVSFEKPFWSEEIRSDGC